MTSDHYVVCFSFCYTSSNGTNTHLRYQLYRNVCFWINVLQVMNQLSDIFNRVNIVVRRRGNQTYTRYREAQLTNVVRNLAAR